jgi:hypothetical protein
VSSGDTVNTVVVTPKSSSLSMILALIKVTEVSTGLYEGEMKSWFIFYVWESKGLGRRIRLAGAALFHLIFRIQKLAGQLSEA